jgi:hypothetical protein
MSTLCQKQTSSERAGLLKELKDQGFHIVQVVPAASYVIAMANKPKARTLASTLPREPTISDDGNRRAQPRWPHVVASVAPDHSVLPVPDASAFEPDAVASQDTTDVHWPAQAEAKKPSPAKSQTPAPRKHKFSGRSEKRKARIAHAGKDQLRADHAHRHKLTHTSADGPRQRLRYQSSMASSPRVSAQARNDQAAAGVDDLGIGVPHCLGPDNVGDENGPRNRLRR